MNCRMSWRLVAALLALMALAQPAGGAVWSCYGAKPGHPTAEERVAFIREVGELAIAAEKKHGVPASALAAIAIAESNYGWTRLALEANNVFAWKAGQASVSTGKAYVLPCARARGARSGFMSFESRAEGFDHVASRLAAIEPYRRHTEEYLAARRSGAAVPPAVDAWIAGIAQRYSGKPERFTKKIRRIMNDPHEPSDRRSPEATLYHLSAGIGPGR